MTGIGANNENATRSLNGLAFRTDLFYGSSYSHIICVINFKII